MKIVLKLGPACSDRFLGFFFSHLYIIKHEPRISWKTRNFRKKKEISPSHYDELDAIHIFLSYCMFDDAIMILILKSISLIQKSIYLILKSMCLSKIYKIQIEFIYYFFFVINFTDSY